MLRKLLIRTWFGDLPSWYPQWLEHTKTLGQYGFDFLVENDLGKFKQRCRNKLGLDIEIKPGTRRAGDFDPTYGVLFEEELQGYHYWGHTGLDCCYGRLDRFVSDEFLDGCDIFGNDPNAICGPFSLYHNDSQVNNLFRRTQWRSILGDKSDHHYAFDEGEFSDLVKIRAQEGAIKFKTAFWQAVDDQPWHKPFPRIHLEPDGTLYDDAQQREIMMFHFHRYRQWPL